MNSYFLLVKLEDLCENGLRTVDKTSKEYKDIVSSIKSTRILCPITVRPIANCFQIVHGLHRYHASLDAGLKLIPCMIMCITDAQVIECQSIASVHKIETKPMQYARALQRIISLDPDLKILDLAKRIDKNPRWVANRLSLLKLISEAGKYVDEGKISLINAYNLAKLSHSDQEDYLAKAMMYDSIEFTRLISVRLKRKKKCI